MRIGFVTTQFVEVGGVENMVRSLAREFSDDHEVSLITRERSQNVDEFEDCFDNVHEIPGTESYLSYLRNGRKFLKQNSDEFDVLHFQNWSTILPAYGLDVPMVLTTHGTSFGMNWERKNRLRALGYWPVEEIAFNIPDVTTSVTEHHLKHFYIRKPTEVIRNGVNTDKFQTLENLQELKQKWGVEGDGILIVGRHVRQKGHLDLIEAVSELENYTLMIPSDGPMRQRLEDKVQELGVNAEFYGKVSEEELVELYNAADLFCLPSVGEGLPLTMLEAMSCGLPVVVSDRGDNKNILQKSGAGSVIEPEQKGNLSTKLKSILDQDLEKMSENAKSFTRNNFSWHKISWQYGNLYGGLVD